MARRGPLQVKVRGVKVTVRDLIKWDNRLKETVKAQTLKEARKALTKARAGKFRDRTGRLRRSIIMRYYRDSETAVVSVPRTGYGVFVNYGFDRRFQFLPVKEIKKKYKAAIRRVIRKRLK